MTDSSEDEEWIFYRDRPDWSDVKPIPQDEGPHEVVKIAYSEKFQDIFDYFRAILAKKEISERAFKLSEDAAIANPANYTVWHYRRILLKELKKDLHEELEFCLQIFRDTNKNYQVWHHRQVMVDWLKDPSKEKELTDWVLSSDAKNYHAWQHRQWVIRKFNLWDGELEYVNQLLIDDVRNNSAWNQRYFVLSHTSKFEDDALSKEIKYTFDCIIKAPNNESPWNYLRGILQDKGFTKFPVVKEFTDKLYNSGCRSPHLLGFIIDSIEENLLAAGDTALCQKALDLCSSLATEHDKIRKEYWNFVARNLGNLYGTEEAHAHVTHSKAYCSK